MVAQVRSLLDRKIKWARENWRALDGPFEIAEDGWLYNEYWKPAHSFRVTAVDTSKLCGDCARDVGELVQEIEKVAEYVAQIQKGRQ